MRAARNYRSAMFTASRLLTDEEYGERKDEIVKWKKWRGRGNDDRPVGSTTVSKNLTIDTKRERIHVFSGRQADAFESILRLIHPSSFVSPVSHPPLSFEEPRRAIATESDRSGALRC